MSTRTRRDQPHPSGPGRDVSLKLSLAPEVAWPAEGVGGADGHAMKVGPKASGVSAIAEKCMRADGTAMAPSGFDDDPGLIQGIKDFADDKFSARWIRSTSNCLRRGRLLRQFAPTVTWWDVCSFGTNRRVLDPEGFSHELGPSLQRAC